MKSARIDRNPGAAWRRAALALLLVFSGVPGVHSQGLYSGGDTGQTNPDCPALTGNPDAAAPPQSLPWLDASLPPETRLDLLFAQLTLEEKVDLATGDACNLYGFFNAPIPRLKIPALAMADGPAGVRLSNNVNGNKATELPAPIALAATWSETLASTYGDLLGSESFITGHNVQLAPAIDIVRDARANRGFESFGEDPLLAGDIGTRVVLGIQSHPVLATAKHASEYNQETNRLFANDAVVDERARMEIYNRPFEIVIKDGDVGSVMCAFNKVNGVYECEDQANLNGVLKGRFGLQGFVMSDFGATQSTVPSALAGLDQEQPSANFFGPKLQAAVQDKTVPMSVLDDKARRVLRPMFKYRLFDVPATVETFPTAQGGNVARQVAEEAIVLLKNTGPLLPLQSNSLKSVAVIGGDAADASAQGGGSSRVQPTYTVSPLAGIKNRLGAGVAVNSANGTDPITAAHTLPGGDTAVPSSVLTPPGQPAGTHGLLASYWNNPNFSGNPEVTRVEKQVATNLGFYNFPGFGASAVPELPADLNTAHLSARWTATLAPPATGQYTFTLWTQGRGTLYINGTPIINDTTSHTGAASTGTMQLTAGVTYSLRVDYVADASNIGMGGGTVGPEALLSWTPPKGTVDPAIAQAATVAKSSDAAIVVVRDFESEGNHDRATLTLPNSQDQLIASIAAANPRTVVVIQTGGAITMPWLASVPAVLQAWYTGQEMGTAIAAVLFGDVNPSGKLPVSFPTSVAESPTSTPEQFPGVGLTVHYTEGINVGYRWFTQNNVTPLFPFGFGLSYTTFQYSGLQVQSATPTAGELQQPINVQFTVTNVGKRAGSEAAQVYVGKLPGSVQTPPRQLAGFSKVQLAPGASETVTVTVPTESVSYWDITKHQWVTPSGVVPIYVGSSSADIHLTGSATIGPAPSGM